MLEADFRVAVTITLSVPAGTTPDQARGMLSNNGISVALGLVQFVREVEATIVPVAGPKLV